MRGYIKDYIRSVDGEQYLTLALHGDFRTSYDTLKDADLDIEIKKYREKRSLSANAYCWVLIHKLADTLRTDKDSIYLEMLKRYGQGGVVSIQERYSDQFKREQKYCESMGTSELNGKTFEHFRFWVGSSNYNTEEMSILIDGIVSECKDLQIETLTPDELARMKEAWGEDYGRLHQNQGKGRAMEADQGT